VSEEPSEPGPKGPSWGNISERHWSRARRGANQEAIEYYRQRSRAPGVREGGGERNFYCMRCDGVIPATPPAEACPHCGAAIEGRARRFFNWVELDQPGASDFAALAKIAVPILVLLVLAAALAWWIFAR
jgi:hypothetical protein